MKALTLIKKLQLLVEEHGNQKVRLYDGDGVFASVAHVMMGIDDDAPEEFVICDQQTAEDLGGE